MVTEIAAMVAGASTEAAEPATTAMPAYDVPASIVGAMGVYRVVWMMMRM